MACDGIKDLPLILGVNSLGFRFMEGRAIFNSAFGIIPAIVEHKKRNLVITACFGQCLGLGALVFGLGHYRIAVEKDTTINLAGPEVFKLFFGEKVEFEHVAGSRRQYVKTDMIHQVVDDVDELNRLIPRVLLACSLTEGSFGKALALNVHSQQVDSHHCPKIEGNVKRLLACASDEYIELFAGYSPQLRIFILHLDGQFFGLVINPLHNVNNMFTYRAITLYSEAVKLFGLLQLPMLAMLDTPGIDPRMDGNNQFTIDKLLELTGQLIEYPYRTMGVITGRGYGGATTLGIPKVYGSQGNYILNQGTEVNVMHESIMRHLLSGSNQLLAQWEENNDKQCPEFSDLVESGTFDAVIDESEIKGLINHHLFDKALVLESDE